jgi:hypothetical protein
LGLLQTGFSLIGHCVKDDFKGNRWHESSEDLQMSFGIIAATTPSNDAPLQIGQRADDAPGMQFFKVGHEALLVKLLGCFFMAS